jgi:hypothetical protein
VEKNLAKILAGFTRCYPVQQTFGRVVFQLVIIIFQKDFGRLKKTSGMSVESRIDEVAS